MGDVKKLKELVDIELSNRERLSKETNELLSRSTCPENDNPHENGQPHEIGQPFFWINATSWQVV